MNPAPLGSHDGLNFMQVITPWCGVKGSLREKLLEKRNNIKPEKRKEKEALIMNRLFEMPEFKRAKNILFYASFKGEVGTKASLRHAIKLGKRIVLPRVDREQKCLRLYEIKNTSELVRGYMGIPEPGILKGREMSLKDIDVVIVPGVGFDIKGNRLGYGAGYYDRLLSYASLQLSGSKRHIPTIALAFEEHIVPALPNEGHDVKIDKIVTEKRVINYEQKED